MRKLWKFVVELILVAIVVGWLLIKYPATIDSVIPWIALAILWHLTWEVVLQSQFVKSWSIAVKRKLGIMAWVVAFVAGGLISVGYLASVKGGLAKLDAIGAKNKQGAETHSGSVEKPPSETRQPTAAEIAEELAKRLPKGKEKGGPRLGTGPEAYKDLADDQVGQWAIEEADKIEQMAKQAMGDNIGSMRGRIWRFTNDFDDCCTQDVKDLRTEILQRLGPPAKDSEEASAWKMLFVNESYPGAPHEIHPMEVQHYAPYLRRIGLKLKRRAVPRSAPVALHFSEKQENAEDSFTLNAVNNADQFSGGPNLFPFKMMVTIDTKAQISSGYIVVEFDSRFAGAQCDFVDSKLVIDRDVVDNKELADYLATRQGTTYALAIGKTPFTSNKPIHVFAKGRVPFHVAKVTPFDE